MWDLLINNPIVNALLLLYGLLGHQFILAITALTIIIRLILFPLTLKQQRSTQMMQALQSSAEWQAIQKKYKNDKEKLAQEQMRMYRVYGVSPFGGCLPMLVQFPIWIGLYQSINRAVATSPLQLMGLSGRLYAFLPGLATLLPMNDRFLWLNLGKPDEYYVLPVLVVISQWFVQKLLTPPNPEPQAASMNQSMQIMMPLMLGLFAMSFPSGLAIYFVVSNLASLVQYSAINYWYRDRWQNEANFTMASVQDLPTRSNDVAPETPKPAVDKAKRKTGKKQRKRKTPINK